MRQVSWSEPCQEFAAHNRLSLALCERPKSVSQRHLFRLRRAFGGDRGNGGNAEADFHVDDVGRGSAGCKRRRCTQPQ
jgi:hypothetical protein